MSDILIAVISAVGSILITLISVGLPLILQKTKSIKDARLIEMTDSLLVNIADEAAKAVAFVKQTFVDALKASGGFDEEKQKEALQMATDTVLANLPDRLVQFAEEQAIDVIGKVQTFVEAKIGEMK